MDFSVSSLLNVTNLIWKTRSDIFASIVTLLTITLVVLFPGLVYFLVKKNHE